MRNIRRQAVKQLIGKYTIWLLGITLLFFALAAGGTELSGLDALKNIDKDTLNINPDAIDTDEDEDAAEIDRSFEVFTPEQEYYLGRAVAATIAGKYKPYNDQKANRYVNRLGQTLAQFSDRPETYGGYHFRILDSDEINAFAAPGGLIFITRGMLRCTQHEDALAAVLAYEIGHVQYKHGLQEIKKSRLNSMSKIKRKELEAAMQDLYEAEDDLSEAQDDLSEAQDDLKEAQDDLDEANDELSALKGLANGMLDLADTMDVLDSEIARLNEITKILEHSINDITTTLIDNGYSQAFEREADKAAAMILQRAGYNPNGLVDILKVMEERLDPEGKDFAKTHPSPASRIAEIQEIAGDYGEVNTPKVRQERFETALGNM
jgi:hypothetical protein